jgi:ABC-type antimicrobial peptide transport system permease subunit
VRTSEIGIRMALGARPADVMREVLRSAFFQVGIGLVVGIPIAIGAGRLIASKLFEVRSYDPFVLAAAVLTLAACALVASILPARNAAAVDPVRAMRTE